MAKKIMGEIEVDIERCKGCGICIVNCPTGAISLSQQVNSKGYNYCQLSSRDNCIGCANCAITCCDSAITVYKKTLV